ncbi:hypothetical protein [Streptomyces sp. NPDC002889]|uniref:hypothetical protein n=1 Tax=Streptomyces sp. NPDC002889 TaxID=3364669 RepID=UPI0036A19F98
MFSEPEEPTATRMRGARAIACTALTVRDIAEEPVWGYAGRTLSGAVTGRGWLRLVSERADRAGGRLWEGPRTAQEVLPVTVPRPVLRQIHDWSTDGWSYRAELYEYTPTAVDSRSPVLDAEVELPEPWLTDLSCALETLAAVPTDRVSVREEYIRRAVPEFTGHTVGTIEWSTAHGDFHWANLAGADLVILDWEGWGAAPYGFDAALLHLYALRAPKTAARVRETLAPILDRPEARVAELTVCTQVLQAADRTPFYTALAEPVRQFLDQTRHQLPW